MAWDILYQGDAPVAAAVPANTGLPTVSGVATVGNILSSTTGTWSNPPILSYSYQWQRSTTGTSGWADITGATSATYTLAAGDAGYYMRCGTKATNSVGTAPQFSYSTATGQVAAAGGVPSNTAIPVLSGSATVGSVLTTSSGSWTNTPITSYAYQWQRSANGSTGWADISGATSSSYTIVLGDLTYYIRSRVYATNSIGQSTQPAYSAASQQVAAAPTAGSLSTTFTITSTVGGADLPFAFGHVFKQGDVAANQIALASGTSDWQCTPTTYWPDDGSVRHAIIAGRATCTANVAKTLTLTSGSNPGGTALTTTDLKAAIPASTSITVGGTTMTLAGTFLDGYHRRVCEGPVMSNWIYRLPVAGNNHLVIWADVRLYKGNNVEIFPWVENCYTLVSSPTNFSVACSVLVGGSSKFSATLDIKHHTRVPLIDNSAASFKYFSYWSVSDPQITPKHDTTYLTSTKMVPNYRTVSSGTGYAQSFTPNWIGDTDAGMGAPGFGAFIGLLPDWSAGYLSSGGAATAYRSVIANGLAAGAWSVHYRNDPSIVANGTTGAAPNEVPTFKQYPSASISWGGTPSIPSGSGGVNQKAGEPAVPDTSHQPSLAYLPWLLTGRWYFLEEVLFWDWWNYLDGNYSAPYRNFADGIEFSSQVRARAWNLRTRAQALAITPQGHTSYASLKASWEANMNAYKGAYIDGTRDGGVLKNSIGCIGLYSSVSSPPAGSPYFPGNGTYYWDAPWMQSFAALAFGHAWDLNLPQSTQSAHLAVRDFAYSAVVARAGDGSGGGWSYRRFAVFQVPYAQGESMLSGPWISSYSVQYSVYVSKGLDGTNPLSALPAGTGIYYGNQLVAGDMFRYHSAVAPHFAALSMAIDHGVSGAQDGWTRITQSSSFSGAETAYATNPVWALTPRVPAWAQGQNVNEWREISNTKLSSAPYYAMGASNEPQGKQDAWIGWHVDQRTGKVYSVANGGHDDYWGNEVDVIDLTANAPVWTELLASSPSSVVTSNSDYYTDGKPCSRHSYYSAIFIESLNRAMLFTEMSRSTGGNGTNELAAYNITTNAYDARGTFGGIVPFNGQGTGTMTCAKHPTTEAVYVVNSVYGIWRWTPGIPGSWALLEGNSPTNTFYTAAAIDPTRGTAGRMLILGTDGSDGTATLACYFDIGTNSFVTLSQADPNMAFLAGNGAHGLVYVQAIDKFVCRPATSGGTVYFIDPATWAVTTINPSTGAAIPDLRGSLGAGRPFGKFLYIPSLGGCVYGPGWAANLWFLKLHN